MIQQIEQLVAAAGLAAPLAFVLLYAALTVALVPGSPASVAAGALFGPVWGTLLTVGGATLGAGGAFAIARGAGRRRVRRRLGPRAARLDEQLAGRGFLAVVALRLMPVVPFNALNYALGLTSVRGRDYLPATAIGIVPGTFALVALGSSLGDPGSPAFLAALALVVALVAGGALRARRPARRRS